MVIEIEILLVEPFSPHLGHCQGAALLQTQVWQPRPWPVAPLPHRLMADR